MVRSAATTPCARVRPCNTSSRAALSRLKPSGMPALHRGNSAACSARPSPPMCQSFGGSAIRAATWSLPLAPVVSQGVLGDDTGRTATDAG